MNSSIDLTNEISNLALKTNSELAPEVAPQTDVPQESTTQTVSSDDVGRTLDVTA